MNQKDETTIVLTIFTAAVVFCTIAAMLVQAWKMATP